MTFTYDAYAELIRLLMSHNYKIATYYDWEQYDKCVILRHDIDFSLEKALPMAELENKLGVKSTYFVLVTSDFYNVFSKNSRQQLKRIMSLGHEIGLHYDEVCYDGLDIVSNIIKECNVLETAIDSKVRTVSMHRPSRDTLEKNITIDNVVNSYSNLFFKEFKYLSDSRKHWKEPVRFAPPPNRQEI